MGLGFSPSPPTYLLKKARNDKNEKKTKNAQKKKKIEKNEIMRKVGVGARSVFGPEGWGAQNFELFFPSPVPMFSLFLSLESPRGILVVCEDSGCRVKPRRPRGGRSGREGPGGGNEEIIQTIKTFKN